eukprot:CAMPEP_0177717326 /NCGR_PEP_ID=MMETSP0484_2-20121128/14974_1 /TAXON_ID=354590 /ORGANISM="Rhodomonas lens, Strain RHODO" /LENGTH=134 /DNA_ID=CAMNT_0019229397 /DNA_START=1015 /DNA_END=1416 /DNA_ORIENTATION=+
MICPAGDLRGGPRPAQVDSWKLIAHLVWLVTAVVCVAQTELPRRIVAPALDRPVFKEDTVEVSAPRVARAYLPDPSALTEVDERKRSSHFPRVITTISCISEAELAFVVLSPALDCTVVKSGASVITSSLDLHW